MENPTDELINSFVARLQRAGELVQKEDNGSRLIQFEATLPNRMPLSYESFLSRYSFVPFDAGGISFFGWYSTSGEDPDMIPKTNRDMSKELGSGGYVQIGRPDTGHYDPVCFDLNQPRQNREWRIVLADHEQILQWSRIKILQELWPSFRNLVEHYLSLP